VGGKATKGERKIRLSQEICGITLLVFNYKLGVRAKSKLASGKGSEGVTNFSRT
jgi:hypothetical protein